MLNRDVQFRPLHVSGGSGTGRGRGIALVEVPGVALTFAATKLEEADTETMAQSFTCAF